MTRYPTHEAAETAAYRAKLCYGFHDGDGCFYTGTAKELDDCRWKNRPSPNPEIVAEEAGKISATMPEWLAVVDTESTWCFILQHATEPWQVFVDLSDYKKYMASPSWPRGPAPGRQYYDVADTKHISTAVARGPEAFAQAVEKRLLPHIREEWPKVQARIDLDISDAAARAATVALLCELAGTKPSRNYPDSLYPNNTKYLYKITVDHDGRNCMLDFNHSSVPLDFAKKLIALAQEN